MPDPMTEALIITGGHPGIDTVIGFLRDGTISGEFGYYGNLNQARYAHACGSYLSSSAIPVS